MLNSETGEVNSIGADRPGDDEDELRIYIIMRKDIGEACSKAKFGVQVAHAALTTFVMCQQSDPQRTAQYMKVAQAKIVLQVPSETELREIYSRAKEAGFPASLITDAGRTEFNQPTTTAAAIGPIWWKRESKKLLKDLPTYRS